MNTRKLRRLVAAGSRCIDWNPVGPHWVPIFRSKHHKARAQRFRARHKA